MISSCLESVYATRQDEVIVVDNASSDSTVELIRKQFAHVVLVENSENRGFAAAANQGSQASTGKWLLFLNPDTVLQQNFFQQLVSFIEQHPQASIIGCQSLNADGIYQPSCWKPLSIKTISLESVLPYMMSLKLVTERPTDICEVATVSGACIVIRRKVFEALGGFDARFFLYYEDVDFCLRARQHGFKVYFFPEAKTVHHGGKSSWQDAQSLFIHTYTSRLRFYKKHLSPVMYRTAKVIVVLGVLLRVTAYTIVGILSFNTQLLRLSKYHTFVLLKILFDKTD